MLWLVLTACGRPEAPAPPPPVPAAPDDRPNVVFVVADDLGYGDLSVYGGGVPTPNLDRLAAEGLRFTDGHVTGTVCSPSRSALHTGRYQARWGHDVNPVGVDPREAGLPTSERTLGDRLRAVGYRTGLVGKWHLGAGPGAMPNDRGYDEFYGFTASSTYLVHPGPDDVAIPLPETEDRPNRARRLFRDREVVEEDGVLTDVLAREAVSFVERNRETPFFLVFAPYDVHVPLQATAAHLARVSPEVTDPTRRVVAAMTLALDDAVGRVVAAINAAELDRETLVVFLSDNGCPAYLEGACSNAPFAGHKRDLREGGHRVPMMARWTGVIEGGRVYGEPVSSLDLGATAIALAGADASGLDGVSLLPLLRGESDAPPHERLFWRAGANYAVRQGAWKLLVAETPTGAAAELLFDLGADPGETVNLATAHPELVAELKSAYEQWNQGNIPPKFTPRKLETTIAGVAVSMSF